MKQIKVQISATLLKDFKCAAKTAYPNETYAILLGKKDFLGGHSITCLFYPDDVDKFCTENHIAIQDHWYKEAFKYAKLNDISVLGDIHSHPSGELGPSECDLDNQTDSSCEIFAICGISKTRRGLRARIRFWPSGTVVKTKVID